MFTTLSFLLLLLFILGFWIVKGSKVPLAVKVTAISAFFLFCVIMGSTLDSSMGWAAIGKVGKNIPDIVTIRSVVIREPNENLNFNGSIYLLLDMSETKTDTLLLRLFAHTPEGIEPRLYRIPYSRSFHEELQRNVIPKLLKGQTVTGRLRKGTPGAGPGEGEGDENGNDNGNGRGRSGGTDDDRNTEFHFYNLPPSYFQPKSE